MPSVAQPSCSSRQNSKLLFQKASVDPSPTPGSNPLLENPILPEISSILPNLDPTLPDFNTTYSYLVNNHPPTQFLNLPAHPNPQILLTYPPNSIFPSLPLQLVPELVPTDLEAREPPSKVRCPNFELAEPQPKASDFGQNKVHYFNLEPSHEEFEQLKIVQNFVFSGEGFLLPDCDPVMKRSIIFTNAMNDHYKRSEDRVEAIYKKFEQRDAKMTYDQNAVNIKKRIHRRLLEVIKFHVKNQKKIQKDYFFKYLQSGQHIERIMKCEEIVESSGVPVLSKDDRMFYADYQKKKNVFFAKKFLQFQPKKISVAGKSRRTTEEELNQTFHI
nr:protein T24E12.6 [imported] - Caenorhabditis elegans [Caenorhabditis elegans]